MDRFDSRLPRVSSRSDLRVRGRGGIGYLRRLVLEEDEKAPDHHMKARVIIAIGLLLGSSAGQALACSFCYGAPDAKSSEHMAVAIWVLMGVIMSVMGGVGAFSFHLWKHGNTPLEPHQELTDEDLKPYE
jgi:flagellar basal body-associated protein FliL